MSVDKKDPSKDDSEDSMESSPEGEAPPAPPQQPAENQQPKRKGGRKPIYATSEERKQRNRQAQAAFRERRTEYIKQLEEAIRTHEQNLANLQAAHRHAADECLMLRYKNSLLERILLEKGIDVQAELRAKTGSPNLGPTHVPQNLVQPPPIQRAILNRHHARRSQSGIAPKLEPGIPVSPLPPPIQPNPSALSPRHRQTPSSHSGSPAGTTSFGSQHGASPAASDQMNPPVRPSMPPVTAMKAPPPHLAPLHGLPGIRQMQNHIEQLGKLAQQEYDAAADMMEDPGDTPDTPSGPGPYPGPSYAGEPQPMSLASPVSTGPPAGHTIAGQSPIDHGANSQQPTYPSMTQLLDPSYDFDPFGLSASMAFPTQFSFDTSNMR
ncbi:uncharacterized protein B0T15DRAFT_562471 [Chaetomium strumarium]|uniref:BZIP domain-containing protein n=1 Tax=Chaetomium strumarium TaxID=1170767 RepID=A0AAJ0LYN1_9PEZI|nr:hypothetical protein B0T15DRAFT_562471 [Chaetomium strumarium]